MSIRKETPVDVAGIRKINTDAFGTSGEADFVEALREKASPLISLVAEKDGQLVGHIFFSPVQLAGCEKELALFGLAPMAVLPEWQKKGIGSKLVKEGLRRCTASGFDAVVVLGHPDFYPRFGFETSRIYGIKSEYDVPDNLFMVIELKKDSLKDVSGTIQYHEVFHAM